MSMAYQTYGCHKFRRLLENHLLDVMRATRLFPLRTWEAVATPRRLRMQFP